MDSRENRLLVELSRQVPSLPATGFLATGLPWQQWSLETNPSFYLTRPCARWFLTHLQTLSLYPAPHTGHFPTLTLHDPYNSCSCPELCLRPKKLNFRSAIWIQVPWSPGLEFDSWCGDPKWKLCHGFPWPWGSSCLLVLVFSQISHSPCCPSLSHENHFSQLPQPRFPWGNKSVPHKYVVSFKQIFTVALQ